MFEALKPLLESGLLNEDTKKQLEEAWSAKLEEARGQIRDEIRTEMAGRYEHDRANMVEALDKMVNESLTGELEKIRAETDISRKRQLIDLYSESFNENDTLSFQFTRNISGYEEPYVYAAA